MTLPLLAIVLFAAGLALLAAESFVPGFGIPGVLGLIAGVAAIVVCFVIGQKVGVIVLALAAVLGPVAASVWVGILARTPVGRKLVLPSARSGGSSPCPPP